MSGSRLEKVTNAFNCAINYALDNCGAECGTFLRLWRVGDWEVIRDEFPGFDLSSQPGAIPRKRASKKVQAQGDRATIN